MKDKLKHWLKIDHITFLLILPSLFISKYLAMLFWLIAFLYDIYEGYTKEESR